MQDFLPVTREDMKSRGWDELDFVYVTGDAYVDHPSFGSAIIGRLLESRGYRVGMIPQPDWRKKESIQVFGEPRLGFLVTAGNMDSMVNHYTVSKKHRSTDAYSPGGKMGLRPDRASVVYSNLIRQTYKHTPIILGGIEASLRRMAHYDYWENKVKHSILIDSGADLISYGMGEHSILRSQKPCKAGFRSRRSHMWQGRFLKATISAGFTIRWTFRHLNRYRPIKKLMRTALPFSTETQIHLQQSLWQNLMGTVDM